MKDFAGREVARLVTDSADFEDFVMSNLHHVDRQALRHGVTFGQIYNEYVLDVTERLVEYPFVVVAHYDDERGTIRMHYLPPTMWETKTAYQRHCDELYNETSMQPWLERLKTAVLNKESEVTFRDMDDQPNDNEHALNNKQAFWLRNQGFRVDWEKYPREWIVKEIA